MHNLREVVERAAAGDAAARAELAQATWPDVYRIAYSLLHDPHAAQDAAQEASARTWSRIEQLQSPERFNVWLYRIVTNECRRLKRRDDRYVPHADPPAFPYEHDSDDLIDVRRAIASLDASLRIVVLLRYYYNLTSAEIAYVLAISPVTIRWRLMIAHRRLRGLLAEDASVPATPPSSGVVYVNESIVNNR
ncbi:MAG TPA: RNA polymerase sigma factor [Candidatus Baltobacteraceae bacterium]|jgi:RNA polymerase sigma-70 factor (ECF subfamily)|nr:RNA polymerase sigma factor [Candidatus Baltobacteraceae bacterium]